MHEKGMCHRDLKIENLLVDRNMRLVGRFAAPARSRASEWRGWCGVVLRGAAWWAGCFTFGIEHGAFPD
jgi:serine/threonine protein kinase